MFRPILIGAALIAAPVFAQTTPSAPAPAAAPAAAQGDDAVAAETAPEVVAANREVGAVAQFDNGAVTAVNAANQARYQADVRRYRAAMRAHRRTIAADAALQADRERAYAMAMSDWRDQVAACKRGRTRACRMPSPNPANYM
jgi:hypothetical protein